MIEIEQAPERIPARPLWTWLAISLGVIALSTLLTVLLARGPRAAAAVPQRTRTWREVQLTKVPEEVSKVESVIFRVPAAGELDRARARARLSQYGWVDRAGGRAHIPIDVAMELYVRSHGATP